MHICVRHFVFRLSTSGRTNERVIITSSSKRAVVVVFVFVIVSFWCSSEKPVSIPEQKTFICDKKHIDDKSKEEKKGGVGYYEDGRY
jgi:hypothetical protein